MPEPTPPPGSEPIDPWSHRSELMKCCSCMWFILKPGATSEFNEIGRCRKHAPTHDGWPVVFTIDWCGDHKLDELCVE